MHLDQISTQTVIGRLVLPTPFLSSGMDTVTDARVAIAMAESGGLGIVHRNCSTEEQVEMCKEVSAHFCNGIYPVGAGFSPFDEKRAIELSKYCNLLMMDIAHADKPEVIMKTKSILKNMNGGCGLIFGSVGTYDSAERAMTEFGDYESFYGLRAGVGSGSICTTSEVTRAGSPTAYATAKVTDAVERYVDSCGGPYSVVADGGMTNAGDVALAIALGARAVMSGRLFAGCNESPGDVKIIDGQTYKSYRGMGSAEAMAKRKAEDRYAKTAKTVPEGISSLVLCQGSIYDVMSRLKEGLKASLGYAGARNIECLRDKAQLAIVTPEDKYTTRGLRR
jgi:IMP dehydrogenase